MPTECRDPAKRMRIEGMIGHFVPLGIHVEKYRPPWQLRILEKAGLPTPRAKQAG